MVCDGPPQVAVLMPPQFEFTIHGHGARDFRCGCHTRAVRRLEPLFSIFLLALAGCKSDGGNEKSGCDLDALAKLAGTLESAAKADQVTIVWPGIVDACGSAMPEDLKSYFDFAHDPTSSRENARLTPPSDALTAMKRKACPDWEQGARAIADAPASARAEMLHRGCNFGRYGVIADNEIATNTTAILTWAMHQWFLDQGLAPEHANTITRALYALDERGSSPMHGLANLRWPAAEGLPLTHGIPVVVTQTEITCNDQMIARLADGELADRDVRNHVILTLFDQLDEEVLKSKQIAEMRGEAWNEPLLIAADARTPFATIVDVMFTAGRAEFSRFCFIVAPESGDLAYIPVSPPRHESSNDPQEPTLAMTIELHSDGLSLSRGAAYDGQPETHARGASNEILAYAKAVRRDNPLAHEVVISAEGDVPLQDVLAAIAAARGPTCSQGGDGCVLPDVIITSGGAHRYQYPEARPAISDDDVWGGLTGAEVSEAYGVGVIGLGNTGLIGKGDNPGAGFGGQGKSTVRQDKAQVKGTLDADIIRRIVRAHINEVRSCYNAGLTKNPELEGRVTIDFVIASTGKVGVSKLAENTLSDDNVGHCIAKAVKRWTFPKPRDGGMVEVSYPFQLSPG
jgi:biopolymer transport protein ExbD